jgi:hypothetical protein
MALTREPFVIKRGASLLKAGSLVWIMEKNSEKWQTIVNTAGDEKVQGEEIYEGR